MTVILRPPLSKSDAQRALVLADIVGHELRLDDELPRDVQVLRAGLAGLHHPESTIDCHDGGAPFRFLVTQACVQPSRVAVFTGSPRLGERPHGPLLDSLRGAIESLELEQGTPWPLIVRTPPAITATRFEVTGLESSQFASSLLLGAARLAWVNRSPCEVIIRGALTSEGYWEMTKAWVARAGFVLSDVPGGVRVAVGSASAALEVPGDWSSLTYLLVLAWKAGAPVERVDFTAAHPDRAIVEHLESLGLTVTRGPLVQVTGQARGGLLVDAQRCPDAVPTLAALAAVLEAPSVFTRCGILRHKESDRLDATRELLHLAGATTTVVDETLTVTPGPLHDFSFDARDDHRMAMSAAVLGFLAGVTVTLRGREAVAKSFPGFWREAAKVGVR